MELPQTISATRNQEIIIADYYNVTIINMRGTVITEFGSHGKEDGQFEKIHGLVVNSLGQIVIADSQRVQVFNEDGKFSHGFYLGPEDRRNPYGGICVDQDNNIIVADNKNSKISIFSPFGVLIQQIQNPLDDNRIVDLCILDRNIIACHRDNYISFYSNY